MSLLTVYHSLSRLPPFVGPKIDEAFAHLRELGIKEMAETLRANEMADNMRDRMSNTFHRRSRQLLAPTLGFTILKSLSKSDSLQGPGMINEQAGCCLDTH